MHFKINCITAPFDKTQLSIYREGSNKHIFWRFGNLNFTYYGTLQQPECLYSGCWSINCWRSLYSGISGTLIAMSMSNMHMLALSLMGSRPGFKLGTTLNNHKIWSARSTIWANSPLWLIVIFLSTMALLFIKQQKKTFAEILSIFLQVVKIDKNRDNCSVTNININLDSQISKKVYQI